MKLPAERRFWRIQTAGVALSRSHRSTIGSEEDDLGQEEGTSATASFAALREWAQGGFANWIGAVEIVQFWGLRLGRGQDGEPVVVPVKEVARYQITGGRNFGTRISDQLKRARTVRDLRALRVPRLPVGS